MKESKISIYINEFSHVVTSSSSEWARCIQRYLDEHRMSATQVDVHLVRRGNTGVSEIFVKRDLMQFSPNSRIHFVDREPTLITQLRETQESRYGCPGVRFFADGDTYHVICDATGHHRRNYSAF